MWLLKTELSIKFQLYEPHVLGAILWDSTQRDHARQDQPTTPMYEYRLRGGRSYFSRETGNPNLCGNILILFFLFLFFS